MVLTPHRARSAASLTVNQGLSGAYLGRELNSIDTDVQMGHRFIGKIHDLKKTGRKTAGFAIFCLLVWAAMPQPVVAQVCESVSDRGD
jgi:hypothetical protein